MSANLNADVLILGGGIAGLWTLAHLRRQGFECVLVESTALGAGQTVASQGIIHGGLKYALDGQVGSAAAAIATMPEVWRSCLTGEPGSPIDLRGVPILSPHYHYWTSAGVLSRLAGAGASKVMRTPVERVALADRPAPLLSAPTGLGGVDVYRVGEMVLDGRALVEKLSQSGRGRIIHGAINSPVDPGRDGMRLGVRCNDGQDLRIRCASIVLAAGAGNEQLLSHFNISSSIRVTAQRRPLHMVLLRGAPEPFFGHCVGTSSSPRLTITSGTLLATGEHVWYIGGQLAEDGVGRSETEQIAAAKREFDACMPWFTLPDSARWATLRIDRAEGVPAAGAAAALMPGLRPDLPVVARAGNIIAAWPSKLALAPLLGEEILRQLAEMKVTPRADGALDPAIPCPPRVAPHVWDREEIRWS